MDDYEYLIDDFFDTTVRLHRQPFFRDRYNPFDWIDDSSSIELYRFDRQSILDITGRLQYHLQTSSGIGVPPLLQVTLTLKYLAHGLTIRTLSEYFGIGKSSISRIIHKVTSAICAEFKSEIVFNDEDIVRRKIEFSRIAGFPNVIGAIDGTLIPIQRPFINEHIYVCRKGYHAINCMAVVDANLMFTYLSCKFPGTANDAFVFRSSDLFSVLENGQVNGVLLGDSAYPLSGYLMTPFLDSEDMSPEMRAYNASHAKTRNVVERSFGVLKSRFRCLDKSGGPLRMQPDRCLRIISACFLLHNFARSKNLPDPEMIIEESSILPTDVSDILHHPADPTAIEIRAAIANRISQN